MLLELSRFGAPTTQIIECKIKKGQHRFKQNYSNYSHTIFTDVVVVKMNRRQN